MQGKPNFFHKKETNELVEWKTVISVRVETLKATTVTIDLGSDGYYVDNRVRKNALGVPY